MCKSNPSWNLIKSEISGRVSSQIYGVSDTFLEGESIYMFFGRPFPFLSLSTPRCDKQGLPSVSILTPQFYRAAWGAVLTLTFYIHHPHTWRLALSSADYYVGNLTQRSQCFFQNQFWCITLIRVTSRHT